MRYELDANGYVSSVYWGCNSGSCKVYTGIVPIGYDDLNDWSENAIINAYYISEEGDLILDSERLIELEDQIEQDYIDNMPILYKDLYGTNNVLDDQYQKVTAEGLVIEADNVKKINPIVLFSNIDCYKIDRLDIVTQGKQMLKNDAETKEIAGMTFTKNRDGSILINGTSTEAIEYNISGGSGNASPIFALKNNLDYYLNLGGLSCSMKYYDGETTGIVYEGIDGVINLPENKMVTQVVLTIAAGTTIENKKIYPMLNYGSEPYEYEEYKIKKLPLDFSEYINSEVLFPSDDLFPADDLYPLGTSIGYILVENGRVFILVDGTEKYLTKGNVNLFDGYNLVYSMQDTPINMTYNTNNLALEGTVTNNQAFRIDEEGNVYATGGKIGGFTISEDKIIGEIIPPKDYTMEDFNKVREYLNGNIELSDEELAHYDYNEDGVVTLSDYLTISKIAYANVSSKKPGVVEINSKSFASDTIVIKDGDGNEVVSLGLLNVTLPNLNVTGSGAKYEKNVMSLGLEENITSKISTAWTEAKVPLYVDQFAAGERLFHSDGAIEIGEGVKSVLINANTMVKGVTGDIFLRIKKNDTVISQGYFKPSTTGEYGVISISPKGLEVEEGDIISLFVGSGVTGTLTIAGGMYTYLTVQTIE